MGSIRDGDLLGGSTNISAQEVKNIPTPVHQARQPLPRDRDRPVRGWAELGRGFLSAKSNSATRPN